MKFQFVDLKPQYHALKSEIHNRLETVLDHGQFILGPEVSECESTLSEFTGAKYALTCASGTDALLMALLALDVGPGDEVITTSFSFIATAEVIALIGAVPVFVDIDPCTYNLIPEQVQEAITNKTKAIVPVSLYGQPANMSEINDIALKHSLPVIEDAAQSFGAMYKGQRSCNLSTIGCTSFFPAKPLGCYGDGGAVFTNDEALAEKMKEIRNHGQKQRYTHESIGINGRMDTIQCAILNAKLLRYNQEIEMRQAVASRYTEGLASLNGSLVTLPQVLDDRTSVWAQYTLRSKQREEIREKLTELGVPTAIHYPSTMADQPAYIHRSRVHRADHARTASKEVFSLPMYADLDTETQGAIVDLVVKAVGSL